MGKQRKSLQPKKRVAESTAATSTSKRPHKVGGGAGVKAKPASLDQLKAQRDAARERQDWATADVLRERIAALGVKLQDHGTHSEVAVDKKAKAERKRAKKERQRGGALVAGAAPSKRKPPPPEDAGAEDDPRSLKWTDDAALPPPPRASAADAAAAAGTERVLARGVRVLDLAVGSGTEAKNYGTKVKMEYVGRLATPDGKEFDRSKPGRPLSFKLGTGEVLRKA